MIEQCLFPMKNYVLEKKITFGQKLNKILSMHTRLKINHEPIPLESNSDTAVLSNGQMNQNKRIIHLFCGTNGHCKSASTCTTTGIGSFAVCHGTRQRLKYPRQTICRVLHTAKGTRQIGVGKEALCRVSFIRHTGKSLPSAKKHTAKNFSEN